MSKGDLADERGRGGGNLSAPYPGIGATEYDTAAARLPETARGRFEAFPYLALIPALIVIGLLTIYPVLYSVDLALHKNVLTQPNRHPFVGLENFSDALGNPALHRSVGHTAGFVLLTVGGAVILGVPIALLLNQKFLGAKILQVLILIPWAIPPVMAGIIWRWMFAGNVGVINGALYSLGLIDNYISFFGNPGTAPLTVAAALLWKDLPLAVILLLATLQVIPGELYDATKIDGGGAWAQFRFITLPFLRPALTVVLIFQTIISFVTFDLIFAMTGGGPADATTFVAWYTYNELFTNLNLGRGAALAFVIAVVTLVMAVFYFLALRSERLYTDR
jgi:ABC-type sugar transport system permease subunit